MEEFVGVMIVVGMFIFGLVYMNTWAEKQKKLIENMAPESEVKAIEQKYEAELSNLKERVAVLEKIVTDGQFDLKNEIEKLDAA